MLYSTIIGIDAHARKNVATAVNPLTGEASQIELAGDPELLIEWINSEQFEKPIMAVYESGPTGFPLARALAAAGISCSMAATSKLPSRKDRKKNDKEDSEWLAANTSVAPCVQ